MQPNNQSFFEEGIRLISFCPLCQAKQEKMQVSVLEKSEIGRLLHLQCQSCQAAILALLIVSPSGLNSVGMITDLTAEEVLRFKEIDSVEADEVIEFYKVIKEDKNWLEKIGVDS